MAEASLAASTTQVKESALENKDLRERNAALEAAVPHRRLHDACDCGNAVTIFGKSYDSKTTQLRVLPASPTPGAAREPPLGVAGTLPPRPESRLQ